MTSDTMMTTITQYLKSSNNLSEESKWCINFLLKIRKELKKIQSTDWYIHLLCEVNPEFSDNFKDFIDSPHLEAESQHGLEEFLASFSNLNLPVGTHLGVTGQLFPHFGGHVNLTICQPNHDPMAIKDFECDRTNFKSLWEKEVLTWVSSQFHLYWHANYHKETILLGDSSCLKKELCDYDYDYRFIEHNRVEKLLTSDFSPKVEFMNGLPTLTYHTFTPFGGITRIIKSDNIQETEELIFPYNCEICY